MDELGPLMPAEKESRPEMTIGEFWVLMELIAIMTLSAFTLLHLWFF